MPPRSLIFVLTPDWESFWKLAKLPFHRRWLMGRSPAVKFLLYSSHIFHEKHWGVKLLRGAKTRDGKYLIKCVYLGNENASRGTRMKIQFLFPLSGFFFFLLGFWWRSLWFLVIRYFALLKLKNSSESWEIILRWRKAVPEGGGNVIKTWVVKLLRWLW